MTHARSILAGILIAITSTLVGATQCPHADWPLVTDATTAKAAIFSNPTRKVRFRLDAVVSFRHLPGFPYLAVRDDTGSLLVLLDDRQAGKPYEPGDRLRLIGRATEKDLTISDAYCESVTLLQKTNDFPSLVLQASGSEIAAGRADCAPVRLSGILTASFTDDANPHFRCLIVEDRNQTVYCTIRNSNEQESQRLSELVGKCVTVTGLCHPRPPSPRLHTGKVVFIQSPDDIQKEPDLENLVFQAPDVDDIRDRQSSELDRMGRRKAVGRVLAAFRDGNVILSSGSNAVHHVRLVGSTLPKVGSTVEVLGIPTPDLYHLNLVRAIWRNGAPEIRAPAFPAKTLTTSELFGNRLHPGHLGRTVRVTGTLVSRQASSKCGPCLFIDDGLQLVRVVIQEDVTTGALVPNSTVEATGICVLETDADRVRNRYTRLRGFFVVLTGPESLHIIGRPSWWTPLRLLVLLAVLIALVISVCVWNLMLKVSVKRKGRQLEREIAKRISSDIKVYERTRLAVELHDALSQTLTGVSMEIRAATKALFTSSDRCQRHLEQANRTVDACRGELRDCIWDLRNDAMDIPDMNEAIRRTLAPHLGAAALSVRFSVLRDRFSDNTTHAILRIVRELTVNAIQHGQATAVRVAGTIEGNKFIFSVRDNGCGFDPSAVPGISEGHFGLQGIRERIDRFEGDLVIDSVRGKGTKVTVILQSKGGLP